MLAYVHNVAARVDQRMIFQIWRPPYVHFSICESYFNCYALFGHQKGTSNNAFPNSWFILVFSLGILVPESRWDPRLQVNQLGVP